MKGPDISDRSFFAKMLLLFVLLLLGFAHKRGELNDQMKGMFKNGNMGRIQPTPVAANQSITTHFSR
jgi:hypothetical protein